MMKVKRLSLSILAVTLFAILLIGCELPTTELPNQLPTKDGRLWVHFLDVGQADAILIQFPSGKNMLIDAGNNADAPFVLDYLKKQGVAHLDIAVGTHPHEDHIGALDDVILALPVSQVYLPRVSHTTRTFMDLVEAVKSRGLQATAARPGMAIDVGNGATATILSPINESYGGLNDYSVVVKITHGGHSFLFTGDIETQAEKDLLQSGQDLAADVLKVAHHGASRSSSTEFLRSVGAEFAVISVGKDNEYGHPHDSAVRRLQMAGAEVLRTDLLGTIIAASDGTSLEWNLPLKPQGVRIQSLDPIAEEVAIINYGDKPINLSSWVLVSEVGNQRFTFPDVTLKPGDSLLVVSGPNAKASPSSLVWTKGYIWNNHYDPAALYDDKGRLIERREK